MDIEVVTPARSRRRLWLLMLGLAAYSGVVTGELPVPYATPIAVAVPIAVAAFFAIRSWRRHDRSAARPGARRATVHRSSILRWGALAAILIVWEGHELLSAPRASYPTVSSLVAAASTLRPIHALAFLLWLLIGYRLVEPARA